MCSSHFSPVFPRAVAAALLLLPLTLLLLLQFLLKVAMARLPNNSYLLTLYSNFIIETRRDGQAARTQLQLAIKASPSLLDRCG